MDRSIACSSISTLIKKGMVQGTDASTNTQAESTRQWLKERLRGWGMDVSGDLKLQSRPNLGGGSTSFVATIGGTAAVATVIGLSASKGEGLDILLDSLHQKVTETTGSADQGEGYMITR